MEGRKITAADVRSALKLRYPASSHALLWEVAPNTGGGTRYADAVAFGLWASHGHAIEGIEVKVSRGDFLSEMRQPEKSEPVMRFCNRWWLACPSGMVSPNELPTTWGLLELTEGGQLRQKVKAPKLEPVPPTLGFMAALVRRSAGLDEEMANNEVAKRVAALVAQDTDRLRKQYVDQASERVKAAEEAFKTLDKIKSETGIDLMAYRWNGEKLGDAISLFARLGCKWDGLLGLRNKMRELDSAIDALGI